MHAQYTKVLILHVLSLGTTVFSTIISFEYLFREWVSAFEAEILTIVKSFHTTFTQDTHQ
jgi:hypothetical protein